MRRLAARVPLAAVAILALGIGMSVAMFSLVDAVLLRPLPFPRQEAIDVIWKQDPLAGAQVGELAYPELRDLEENVGEFESVALLPTSLYGYGKVLEVGAGEPVQIESAPVSHDFFRVLGVAPAMGRGFTANDDRVGAAPVVVLSDRVWRQHLQRDPHIVGRMIALNGQGYTVIGVMAAGVEFPRGAGLWVPLGVSATVVERRGATFLEAIARTRPGASRKRVRAAVNALFARQPVDHPDAYSRTQQGVVMPLAEYWTGSARLHLWILLGAAGLLLIASIVSAGNLFLSRSISRQREIATRVALGASRWQIVAGFAREGAVAAGLAALAGLSLADATIHFLVRFAPADIPRLDHAALDARGFLVAAGTAALAALACSVLPGWLAARRNPEEALREAGARTSASRGGRRARAAFLFAQAAATVALLALAVWLTASYRAMMRADTGFEHADTVTMNLALRGPGERPAFYARLLDRLREAPGVTNAAAILLSPLEGAIGWDVSYRFAFEPVREGRELPKANFEVVTPGYFATVGTPLLEGRDFDARDAAGGERVIVINRSLAARIRAAGIAPIGHKMRIGLGGGAWLTIVGVVADARYRSVTEAGPDLYVPDVQASPVTNYLVIRGTRPPEELAALVRQTLERLDPHQAVAGIATLGELVARDTARHRFHMLLLVWFGLCAAVLAALGVYSTMAETVAARRRELAIKTALGALRARLVREMLTGALAIVAAGEAAGLAGAIAIGGWASELLYQVSPRDPVLLAPVAAFLLAVAALAAFSPAWKAAGADPQQSLREG